MTVAWPFNLFLRKRHGWFGRKYQVSDGVPTGDWCHVTRIPSCFFTPWQGLPFPKHVHKCALRLSYLPVCWAQQKTAVEAPNWYQNAWPQTAVMVLDLRKSNNHTVWAKIALFFLAVLWFDAKIFFFLPSWQATTCIKDLLQLKDLHVVTEVCTLPPFQELHCWNQE